MRRRIGLLVVLAFFGLSLAAAQEPAKKPEPAKEQAKEKGKEAEKVAEKKAEKIEGAKPAKLKVLVPTDATVVLTIKKDEKDEGKETKQSGDVREFVTPDLDPTKKYSYLLSALIEPNNYTKITREREVEFKAGDELVVDLRNKGEKDKENVIIRWVPTPDDIVEEMAKLAKIDAKDTVYDLGCGDAITIRIAVKKFQAKKAIGIDIDPEMVKKAKEAVEKDGLKDKVEIREGNILKLDPLNDATVVMVYLGDYMMDQLQPLFEKLKPGSRIVSHRFVMSKWKADKSITVTGLDGDEYNLHLWIVPEKKK